MEEQNNQQPVQPQPAPQPQPMPQPAYGAPMATTLTGGAKFGYLALGFFLGLIGTLIAWLMNKDKPTSGEAIKWSLIGLGICLVLGILFTVLTTVLVASTGTVTSSMSY